MNPFLEYVQGIEAGVEKAKAFSVSGKNECVKSDTKVLLFSPHPDDECITGLLPLRLMREAEMQVVNVPITFGSNVERQPGRAEELKNACAYLGWHIQARSGFDGLEKADVVSILEKEQPQVVFVPHAGDWNSRHIATHHLVMNALAEMPAGFSCAVVETEFWGAMDDPNLMVEADTQSVADLVAATSLHVEEVARNPYHLLMPAWMQDNVRRGGELVGGQGGAVPDFSFATLYRLSKWENGKLVIAEDAERFWAMNDNLKEMF
ncbi:MAG: PIG-L family deacetylase [Verrucomicrobiota bacterium]